MSRRRRGTVTAMAAVAAAVRLPAGPTGPEVVGVVAEDPPWRLPPQTGPDPDRAAHYLAGWDDDQARTPAERVVLLRRLHPAWPLPRSQTIAICERVCACSDVFRLRRLQNVMRQRYPSSGMRNAVLVTIALRERELRAASLTPRSLALLTCLI